MNKNIGLKEELRLFWNTLNIKVGLVYLFGIICIGFGVALMVRSSVGLSSWDTFNYSLHKLIPFLTLGMASGLTATIITFATIFLNRNWIYIVMLVPVYLVSVFIDLFDLVILADVTYTVWWQNIGGFLIGISILPLGGSLMIITGLPAGVYDEFMLVMARKFNTTKIAMVRVIIELSVVVLAIAIGFAAGIGIGKVSIGTLIFSVTVGPYITFYLTIFERIGYYEPKQND